MEYPQILFVKVNNVRHSKVLNGTDAPLICDLVVDGGTTEYSPFDIILRRPKSSGGIQKNTFIFHLPQPSPKFQLVFKKKFVSKASSSVSSNAAANTIANSSGSIPPPSTDATTTPTTTTTTTTTPTTTTTTTPSTTTTTPSTPTFNILARVNVSLQYSTLPTIPRRSSYNSLSTIPANASGETTQSTAVANETTPTNTTTPVTSPNSVSSSIPISTPSSPVLIGGSPTLSGSPNSLSGSPLAMPYSLSAPSSPSDAALSGSPSFISYQNGQRYQSNPTPITASASISSPALATVMNEDETNIRIESSLKWYKLESSNSTHQQGMTNSPTANNLVSSTSFNSLAGVLKSGGDANTSFSKDGDTDSTVSTDDPEIQLQISYEASNAHSLTKIKAYHKDLLDLIVTSKLGLVHAICDSVDITAAQNLAKSLVDVFHSHHKLLHLLKSFMKKEVSLCHDPGTLFRSNSVAMKMVVAYGHKTAQHYLQQTLTPLIVDLCNSPLSLEVDPVKLPQGEDADLNLKNLRIVSQKFFDRIVQSIDQCPKSIIEICYYFKKIVAKKFPTHWKSAVGGFIFLRLICPACVSPENAGIISPGRVGITERRALVLVAKCIQNLSNQVLFNQNYMETINDFIHNNTPALEDFFMKLATRQTDDQTIDGMMVSEESLHDGIIYLQNFIEKNQEKVFKHIENNPNLNGSERPKISRIMEAVDSSKRAVLNSTPIFNKSRSFTTLSGSPNKTEGGTKKFRSNSESQNPNNNNAYGGGSNSNKSWSNLVAKNLKSAKQTLTPALSFQKSQEEEIKVINTDFEWSEKPRAAHLVVSNLLRNVINLCKNNRLTDTQSLKMNGQLLNWTLIQGTPEFAQIARETHELQSVYFENMTIEYITSTFINIFNLLVLHLHFVLGPPNTDVRRKLYNLHKYNIGGDLYSLNDIQHGILRSNPKNALSRVRQIRGGDKRRAFVLPSLDPRIHFALFAVNITIPCMRVFAPNTLLEDLHKCGEEFCSSKIEICVKKKEISLPKVFSHYGTDFGKSRSEMLKWIFQFLIATKRTELLELLEKPSFICLYRIESWNPITIKTKFINDLEEKEIEKKENEKKKEEKEKIFRRKSRSLTHGNRAQNTQKKDSSAITLIHSLKQQANESTKKILSTLNELIKTISESLDINYINSVLSLLKMTAKQLSFNDWKKASTLGVAANSGTASPSNGSVSDRSGSVSGTVPGLTTGKATSQLFSNLQIYCISPTMLSSFAQPLQELYASSLRIEKEMNKFVDFMDIASFAQSNDIAELLLDISNELSNQFQTLKSTNKEEIEPGIKETLQLTINYFTVSFTTKSQIPQPTLSEESLMNSILKELGFDDQSIQQKKFSSTLISSKISNLSNEIEKSTKMSELNQTIQKIKKLGKLLSLFEEQTAGRYSPRNVKPNNI